MVVVPEHLESQIRLLQRGGYRFSSAEQLLEGGGGAPRPGTAVVTFDDGFLDNLTVAAPLLQRLGVRGTFYVCPGMWGQRHELVKGEGAQLLDEDGARQLHEEGMELGAHTMSHPDLRLLGDDQLRSELRDSKAAVEAVTGRPCRTLAYPFGLHDQRVENAAQAAGFELAFAWRPGPWRPFAAPRMPAPVRRGGGLLALKMLGVRRRV